MELVPARPTVDDHRTATRNHESGAVRDQSRRDYYLRRVVLATDLLSVAFATVVTVLVVPQAAMRDLILLLALLPMWAVVFGAYSLYGRDIRRVSHTTVDDIPGVFHAFLLGSVITWLAAAVLPVHKLVFPAILTLCAVGAATMLVLRMVVRGAERRVLGPERVMIVGGGPTASVLVAKMALLREHNLEPVAAMWRDRATIMPPDLADAGELTNADLEATLRIFSIERVVITGIDLDNEPVLNLLRRCKKDGVKVSVVPDLSDAMGPSVEIDHIGGITVLGINPPVLSRSSRIGKRSMDLVGAGALLVLTSPLLFVIAIAVKFGSPGPVLFRQERIGKRGRPFKLNKFRSMVVDAEARRAALLVLSKDARWLHLDHDPRINRIGRLLRNTSLDELPQLWNVVRGDMSLVGPRPLVEDEDRQVDGWRRARLDLTPGITGHWQVLGRTAVPFDEMVKLDYMYVTNWSLWGDIRLVLRTIPVVLNRRGVN